MASIALAGVQAMFPLPAARLHRDGFAAFTSQAISLRHRTSLLLSFKNTKTEHKCSVFWNLLLTLKELLIFDRTLCSVFSQPPKKNNKLSFWSHYPTAALREWVANSLFSDYLIDSKHFKNLLLVCDRFKRVSQMLLKCTPKCILLAK